MQIQPGEPGRRVCLPAAALANPGAGFSLADQRIAGRTGTRLRNVRGHGVEPACQPGLRARQASHSCKPQRRADAAGRLCAPVVRTAAPGIGSARDVMRFACAARSS